MGGTLLSGRTLSGNVDPKRPKVAHKPKGVDGSLSGHQMHDAPRRLYSPVTGQPNCSFVHKSDGGNQVTAPLYRGPSPLENGSGQKGVGESSLGAQGAESAVGYALQVAPECVGDISPSRCAPMSVGPLVHTRGGCLREQDMPFPTNLLQLVSGSGGTSKRRFFTEKVAIKGLLLPPCSTNLDDSNKDIVRRIGGHSGDTRMADCPMVGSVDTYFDRGANQIRLLQGDSDPNGRTESTLPASISRVLSQGEGDASLLTEHAKALLQNDIRTGTHKLYRTRFKIFADYCLNQGHNPTSCPIEIVTNF